MARIHRGHGAKIRASPTKSSGIREVLVVLGILTVVRVVVMSEVVLVIAVKEVEVLSRWCLEVGRILLVILVLTSTVLVSTELLN